MGWARRRLLPRLANEPRSSAAKSRSPSTCTEIVFGCSRTALVSGPSAVHGASSVPAKAWLAYSCSRLTIVIAIATR